MFWSLLKFIIFIALIAALTFGAGWLMEAEGGLRISVADREYTLQPLQAAIAAILLLITVWIVLKLVGFLSALVRFLNGDETAVSRWFDRNRERRGFDAMADAMMALAAGEGRVAMAKAARAERFLNRPELTNLLSAQAAEMTGDARKAEEIYKRLLSDDRTRFVAVRGLMKQRLDAGETDVALKLAQKAFALKPKHMETGDTLLRLQTDKGDWEGARDTLGKKLKAGAVPRDVHRRRDAVLALSEAEDVFADGKTIEAREQAIEANRLSPDLIPAAVMAAQSYLAQGQPKYADRVLRKAWAAQPHPDLASAFASIAPDETPVARLKRFQRLVKEAPDNPETALTLAELNLSAEDFPAARKALGDLADTAPTARSLSIMAAVTRGEGADDAVVRGWLTRALGAPRGPQWICDNCQSIQGEWAPVCDNCAGFDTLTWRDAPGETGVASTGLDMVPLLAGRDADNSKTTDDSTDAAPAQLDVVDLPKTEPLIMESAAETDTRTGAKDPPT
ncbi:MAG: tetratricopeptide repeat protein [Rhodobacteraceae bacterium]|nr:tetratricopeptide repeat protein [Paracoccaceae bacterium]